MKPLFCWRCQAVVPMLDKEEYSEIHRIYLRCAQDKSQDLNERFLPVTQAYSDWTGAEATHHNIVMHHRISIYGPPCRAVGCGVPLRTPRASFCAKCGWQVPKWERTLNG